MTWSAVMVLGIPILSLPYCKQAPVLSTITGMRTSTAVISIDGLTPEAIPSLTQALQAVPGVQNVDFSLERSVAVVEFDVNQSKVDDLLRAVLKAGFKVL